MLNNVAIDVFIGLILVYLLYSLLSTIFQEMLSATLNLRAAVLVKALRVMLEDRPEVAIKHKSALLGYLERLVKYLRSQQHFWGCRLPDDTLAKAFYKHPSIKYLNADPLRSKPSYIEPANFSATLVRVLRGKDYDGGVHEMQAIYNTLFTVDTATMQPTKTASVSVGQVKPVTGEIQTETLDQLRQIYIDAGRDIERFKSLLENWFNETMDRANGWYKRKTRMMLFIIGLGIAIGFNVDTIKVYRVLSTNESAREQMVQMAVQVQQRYPGGAVPTKDSSGMATRATLEKAYNTVSTDIDKAGSILGMGWHKSAAYKNYKSLARTQAGIANRLEAQNKVLTQMIVQAPIIPAGAAKTAYNQQLQQAANTQKAIKEQLKAATAKMVAQRELAYDRFDGGSSIIGWLLTALALTLGAPFWFDLLNKFMSIRGTGAKPAAPKQAALETDARTAGTTTTAPATAKALQPLPEDGQPEFVTDEADVAAVVQG